MERIVIYPSWVAVGIALLAMTPATRAADSRLSLSGIDYVQLCRDTERSPLVYAAIDPASINIWTEQESRRAGRYEQYSFGTKKIDVRTGDDISLYHGLIHRTLDLIGESGWKYRDLPPQEDYEHWLIYHTLEAHWPGAQRRQGGEPNAATLAFAIEYWTLHRSIYREIVAKATTLAAESWCAINVGPPVPEHVVSLPQPRA